MPKIPKKRIKIGGKYWSIETASNMPRSLYGWCSSPDSKGKLIQIRETLKGEAMLDTIIHEMMHARHWDLSEETVCEFATDVARFLFAIGYRAPWDDDCEKR
jgi:hypothetical protein